MEISLIRFIDNKNAEDILVFDTDVEIINFLESYKLESTEIIELNDSVYNVKEISVKLIEDKIEIWVYVDFIDLIENLPTA
ncbi:MULTISPECIES: hypothetical protein [Chryseobacterium]|uniref:Uncharacterized protein n=1 Tax=Chryseobacterium geocarposphaerae TaxID=1416776 RepID=A0A2M9C2H5_9FLAO|nr:MULTISPECIES: hypothetical protein [Chryseobacterium]PJJ64613.1 hypothetical protein CLV73_2977 [Chryseobacterium geocarposphaerae]UMQ40719.1 hypothetical protein MKS83_15095 [Chryseobacterium sp. Y16C]